MNSRPSQPALRVKRLDPRARVPRYHSELAAGLDLAACLDEPVRLEPGEIRMIPVGFSMALDAGWEAQVRPRSGLASRHGITLPNAPGTIDADYRGPVLVPLINHGSEAYTVSDGDRIAQMVVAPVAQVQIQTVDELDETDRGAGGFGSTGSSTG